HYADTAADAKGDLRRFLRKAAIVQLERPEALVCPVIVTRKAQTTLVGLGRVDGFLVASTDVQVVLPDHEILAEPEHFEQVRDELGYADLRLYTPGTTTPYHRGIAATHIPRNARASAELWRQRSHEYLLPKDLARRP
ncbi:MAG: hypothetical protein H0T66_02055, partial [Geodermatophilaceae bacterium]|nr:hypothetical protein [Geodermatophilaceae bacterium]